MLRWREELWPGVPVVFALVDEMDFARLKLPPDVTGGIVKLALADSIRAARAVVPDLDSVVFVGAPWDRQVLFRNWKQEIPAAAAGLNVIEIMGATMTETQRWVQALPERSAILYSAMYSDGEGSFYPPATALKLIAEKANRPIIVAAETYLEPGGTGGFVLVAVLIGAGAAALALRILNGVALEHPRKGDGDGEADLQLAADAALECQGVQPARTAKSAFASRLRGKLNGRAYWSVPCF